MANIKSQIKRNRQNEKLRLRNKSVRAELRTCTKTAVTAAESGAEDSVEALRLAVKRIDKAAAKGVIHKNTAANHKSAWCDGSPPLRRQPPSNADAAALPPGSTGEDSKRRPPHCALRDPLILLARRS